MNSLAEALGMSLPGSAAIPAPLRDRQEAAYLTGKQIVEMVAADRKPSDILTREAFINAIRVNSAIGGSTNAPIHLNALARHIGVELTLADWQTYGEDVPLLVNLQPAGEYLGEDYYRAGGVPAVIAELMRQGLIHEAALTVNGRTIGENCRDAKILDTEVIRPFGRPLKQKAGFTVLRGNLFDSAIMKTQRHLRRFPRALSLEPDRSATPSKDARSCSTDRRTITRASTIRRSASTIARLLFMRGTGPIGYPGAAEVVNMRPPAALIKAGIHHLPCIGDGRQSGTSGSPSILNASPEAAAGGGLALLRTGDRVRIDLKRGEANVLISDEELHVTASRAGTSRRLSDAAASDAVAGNSARLRGTARHGCGAGICDEVSAPRAEDRDATAQSLNCRSGFSPTYSARTGVAAESARAIRFRNGRRNGCAAISNTSPSRT